MGKFRSQRFHRYLVYNVYHIANGIVRETRAVVQNLTLKTVLIPLFAVTRTALTLAGLYVLEVDDADFVSCAASFKVFTRGAAWIDDDMPFTPPSRSVSVRRPNNLDIRLVSISGFK